MKNIYFPDFSFTYGRMCVYGRYAPARGSIPEVKCCPKVVRIHQLMHEF